MKNLLLSILLITVSCDKELNNTYKGYVFNIKKEPLNKVKIYTFRFPKLYTYTNENGYFSLEKRSLNFIDDLVFVKNGYTTDTLNTVFYHRGHGTIYLFLTNRSDTLFMKEVKQETFLNNVLNQ
ncbi:hypothetical protein [uncultured Tenacibaculum sp.]|uniref:hypothetical protein n=1 Tax=uncultured Tenacibaculum sp. TaxID=174713 RepID=UPI0026255B38|nr:hypothetical protein [uncultured Tenacibaculum sp.]